MHVRAEIRSDVHMTQRKKGPMGPFLCGGSQPHSAAYFFILSARGCSTSTSGVGTESCCWRTHETRGNVLGNTCPVAQAALPYAPSISTRVSSTISDTMMKRTIQIAFVAHSSVDRQERRPAVKNARGKLHSRYAMHVSEAAFHLRACRTESQDTPALAAVDQILGIIAAP